MERKPIEDKIMKVRRKDDNLTDLNVSRLKSSGLKNRYDCYLLSALCVLFKDETDFEFFEFHYTTRWLKAVPCSPDSPRLTCLMYFRFKCSNIRQYIKRETKIQSEIIWERCIMIENC